MPTTPPPRGMGHSYNGPRPLTSIPPRAPYHYKRRDVSYSYSTAPHKRQSKGIVRSRGGRSRSRSRVYFVLPEPLPYKPSGPLLPTSRSRVPLKPNAVPADVLLFRLRKKFGNSTSH